MIFQETPLTGAYVIEPERIKDHRGFFARVWCKNELRQQGLETELAQTNVGFSYRKGTLRGLHFQEPPHTEVKIVRCTRGSVFDVIVDLRPESPSYKRWFGVELSEENCKMIYVPEGCAQGYITLTDNAEIYYHTSEFYHPESERGVRWDNSAFDFRWPMAPSVISRRGRAFPDWKP